MAKIRSISEIQEKWSRVTPLRSVEYANGVKDPLKDWEKNTKAGEANFEVGIQRAIAAKSFGKGVDEAGNEKWQGKTLKLGTQRWGPGVMAAGQDYLDGFSPFRDTIEKTALPPRFPRGDIRNLERVKVINEALFKQRTKV